MRSINALAAVAAMSMVSIDFGRDIEVGMSPPPHRVPPHRPKPVDDRDPNHPAVIAAQARQRRKAQRQAKGFVSGRELPRIADGSDANGLTQNPSASNQ